MIKWLWFRGLVRWKVHWGEFETLFQQRWPQDSIQKIDFPGFGDFNTLKCPKDMQGMLDHIDSQVKGEGPFHILAFSLGAMVAAQWAARHPTKVKQLVLINTSDNRSPFYDRFQIHNWGLLFSRIFHPTPEFIEKGILKATSNSPDKRKKYLPLFIEAHRKTPFSRANLVAQLRIASRTRFPEKAPCPTRILNSAGDRMVSPQCSRRLAHHWEVHLLTHPWAGHDITLDDPDWVLQKLHDLREGF